MPSSLDALVLRDVRDSLERVRRDIFDIQRRAGLLPEAAAALIQAGELPRNFMNIDMVVDHLGNGTHAKLYSGAGALQEAIATGQSRTIWLCTTHEETVTAQELLPGLVAGQQITVLSAGFNRPTLKVGGGVGTSALMLFNDNVAPPSSAPDAVLRFEGFGFQRAAGDGASAGPLIQGDGGTQFPRLEFWDIDFKGALWDYLIDCATAGSATVNDITFDWCRAYDAITSLIRLTSISATVGQFVVRHGDFARLANLSDRGVSSAVDPGIKGIIIAHNLFRLITGYAWRRTYNYPFRFYDNTINEFNAAADLIQIGTLGTGLGPYDAVVADNIGYCSAAGASFVRVQSGAATTAENIAISDNAIQGPGSGDMIKFDVPNAHCHVANGWRDWGAEVGGSVGWTAPPVAGAGAGGGAAAGGVAVAENKYDPDIAPSTPGAVDDEFSDSSIGAAWTQFGSPDIISEERFLGYLFIEDNDSADCGVWRAYTPGAVAFTIVCALSFSIRGTNGYAGMVLLDAADIALCTLTMQENLASNRLRVREGAAGGTAVDVAGARDQSKWYLMIQRDATSNYTVYTSRDGMTWWPVDGFSSSGTVARVRLLVNGQITAVTNAAFDFIRSFVGSTFIIGAAPSGSPAVSAGWMQPRPPDMVPARRSAVLTGGYVGPLT